MAEAPRFPPFESFSWDERKREANVLKHGVDFSVAATFDFETAVIRIDNRFDYGELREIGIGFIGSRLYVLVFARRAPAIHVISLRKANHREGNDYAANAKKA
ncbi:MAG: BrnT family toxin [Beijerinckiaceae bacterium]